MSYGFDGHWILYLVKGKYLVIIVDVDEEQIYGHE